MSPATAEFQRRSLEIAMAATQRALRGEQVSPGMAALIAAQEVAKMRTLCRHCGQVIVRWDDPDAERAYGRSPLFVHDNRVDVDCNGIDCDREGETFAEPVPAPADREDEELFSCLTCEDTGEIEVLYRDASGRAVREPWRTYTIACPACNPGGLR